MQGIKNSKEKKRHKRSSRSMLKGRDRTRKKNNNEITKVEHFQLKKRLKKLEKKDNFFKVILQL